MVDPTLPYPRPTGQGPQDATLKTPLSQFGTPTDSSAPGDATLRRRGVLPGESSLPFGTLPGGSASEKMQQAGRYQVAGTDLQLTLAEVAARQPDAQIFMDSTSAVAGPSWPNGCHVCEVELDPATGAVRVLAYASVNDVGRVVNPLIVRGQLDGGAVQGLGQALCEAVAYDPASGQLISGSLMDYALIHAEGAPPFRHLLDESTPCLNNPLGVKGVGELGTIGATPCVVNAVADALARAGRADLAPRLQMPLSPGRLWQLLQRPRG